MDPVRAPDDERAAEALAYKLPKIVSHGTCRRCGCLSTGLVESGLCTMCDFSAEDSRAARRLCDLIHRGKTE